MPCLFLKILTFFIFSSIEEELEEVEEEGIEEEEQQVIDEYGISSLKFL